LNTQTQPVRKRLKRYELPNGARFVTFSCFRRLPLLDHDDARQDFLTALRVSRKRFGCRVAAWVIMPEHVHLMFLPSDRTPLARVLEFIKKSVARRSVAAMKDRRASMLADISRGGDSVRFWQKGGGFDRNVRSESEFQKEVLYIHRNPVKRGLVVAPQEWSWSSARWWLGRADAEFECDPVPWIDADRRVVFV